MTEPIVRTVKRYGCPHCRRTGASKTRIVAHIGQCWRNPTARSCMTCLNYRPADSEVEVGWDIPESCVAGADLTALLDAETGTRQAYPTGCEMWQLRSES